MLFRAGVFQGSCRVNHSSCRHLNRSFRVQIDGANERLPPHDAPTLAGRPVPQIFFCEPPRQAAVAAVWESIHDSLCQPNFFGHSPRHEFVK